MFRGSYTAGSVAFLLLSTTLPAFCLRIFPEMPESARSEELSLPPPPAYKTAPASCYGNRGGSFALGALFSGPHAKPCEGSFGKPRVCGEKFHPGVTANSIKGSPPRMRGKGSDLPRRMRSQRITPAYAGKRRRRRVPAYPSWDHPRVCGETLMLAMAWTHLPGSPPRMRGKGTAIRVDCVPVGITPACAGKGPPDACRQPYA